VIGGVSLRGGSGNVLNAVLGAIFIGVVTNGMNLARIESYYEMIVLGVVLAVAVVADRLRTRLAASLLKGNT
jgi:ribose transport system permease protein